MGKTKLQSDKKVCATCEYWCGDRRPGDRERRWVEFELAQKAECMVRHGYRAHSITPQCQKYKKLGWMQ